MRKFLSLLTVVILCISLLPVPAQAGEIKSKGSQQSLTSTYFIDESGDLYQWRSRESLYSSEDLRSFEPVKIEGIANVIEVSGNPYLGAAVTADGSAYTWGWAGIEHLSEKDFEQSQTPVKVAGLTNVVSVSAASYDYSLAAITADGSLYTWGRKYVGDDKKWNPIIKTYHTPQKVSGLSDVVAVDCNGLTFAAITKSGDLYTWGMEMMGENGYGKFMNSAVPRKILSQVNSVSLGRYTACAVTVDGTLYTWGSNDEHALARSAIEDHGNNRYGDPTPSPALYNIKTACMGETFYGMAIDYDGKLHVWGDYGDPGREKSDYSTTILKEPVTIESDEKFVSLALGQGVNAAVTEKGDLYGWFGTLEPLYLLSGVKVPGEVNGGGSEVTAPPAGTSPQVSPYRTVAPGYVVLQNGDLYQWTPDETVEEGSSLKKVEGISNVVDISVCIDQGSHAPSSVAAVTADGSLYTWGDNHDGILALGDKVDRAAPTKVDLKNVVAVSLGVYSNGAALTSDGSMYVWGSQYRGDDKNYRPKYEDVLKPQKVKSLSNVVSIGCCYSNYGAVTSNGDLYTWGADDSGVNGYGNKHSSPTPRKILENMQSVQLGRMTGCGISKDGELYTWGAASGTSNVDGLPVYTPRKVDIPPVKSVTIGEMFYMAAITVDGQLYMWGNAKIDRQDDGFFNSMPTLIVYDGGKANSAALGWGYSQLLTEDGGLYIWGFNFGYKAGEIGPRPASAQEPTFLMAGVKVPGQSTGSLENFASLTPREYKEGQFTDVEEDQWYGAQQQGTVKRAFELGLVDGMGGGAFAPEGQLRLSEAIKLACTVHSVYAGDGMAFPAASPWYDPYVNYAITQGILRVGDFTDYTATATRAQMAYLFANALPAGALQPVAGALTPPDVAAGDAYAAQIQRLYQAGVLRGDDEAGTFHGGQNITRAQATAIITRLALPDQRAS